MKRAPIGGERNTYTSIICIFLENGPRFEQGTIPTYYHFSPQFPTFCDCNTTRGIYVLQVGISNSGKGTIK